MARKEVNQEAGRIYIKDSVVPLLVKTVYNLSRPVGMGLFHYMPGGLSEDEVGMICARRREGSTRWVMMDYVNGRQCKMDVNIDKDTQRPYIYGAEWYDHSISEFIRLLEVIGVTDPVGEITRCKLENQEVSDAIAFNAYYDVPAFVQLVDAGVKDDDIEVLISARKLSAYAPYRAQDLNLVTIDYNRAYPYDLTPWGRVKLADFMAEDFDLNLFAESGVSRDREQRELQHAV